jgi:uncharacterized damage-inducible protein DinB
MPTSPRQPALACLKFSRKISGDLISTVPEGKLAFQPCPTDNNVLWSLGHLAMTYNWLTGLAGGDAGKLPESYGGLFGGKSKPTGNAKDYPSLSELRMAFDDQYNRFVTTMEKLPEADLSTSVADKTGGFASDKLDLIHKATWHEGWHAGQISSIRRALGLPPVMG